MDFKRQKVQQKISQISCRLQLRISELNLKKIKFFEQKKLHLYTHFNLFIIKI